MQNRADPQWAAVEAWAQELNITPYMLLQIEGTPRTREALIGVVSKSSGLLYDRATGRWEKPIYWRARLTWNLLSKEVQNQPRYQHSDVEGMSADDAYHVTLETVEKAFNIRGVHRLMEALLKANDQRAFVAKMLVRLQRALRIRHDVEAICQGVVTYAKARRALTLEKTLPCERSMWLEPQAPRCLIFRAWVGKFDLDHLTPDQILRNIYLVETAASF